MHEKQDYLWDRSGPPDPAIQKLESLLGQYRYRPRSTRPHRGFSPAYVVLPLALAATLVLWFAGRHGQEQSLFGGYHVARMTGSVSVEAQPVEDEAHIGVGQWLETGDSSIAEVTVANIGSVRVGPKSRLRILSTKPSDHRVELEQGSLHASIWSPPRLFFVETPSATAIDLGCIYTLTVEQDGDALLCVEFGEVALKWDNREVIVPAGARCETRPGEGPAAPYWAGVSEEFRKNLAECNDVSCNTAVLDALLDDAGTCESFSLWHLLARVDENLRGKIYDRLSDVIPPPPSVTRDGIVALDSTMLDIWGSVFDHDEFMPCQGSCTPPELQLNGRPLN